MASLKNSDDVDTGISYEASTPNLQKLLDKVKARKRAAGEEPNRNALLMNYRAMSSRLDDLIEFAGKLPFKTVKTIGQSPLGLGIRKYRNRPLQRYKNLTKHIEDIAKGLSKVRLNAILNDLIEFQGDPDQSEKKRNLAAAAAVTTSLGIEEAATHGALLNQIAKLKGLRFRFSAINNFIQFQDPRPRNKLGEFAPQEEGAPDPNAMVKTYRIAPAQPTMAPGKTGPGLGGLAGLALVGGAAGTVGSEAIKGGGRALAHIYRQLKKR